MLITCGVVSVGCRADERARLRNRDQQTLQVPFPTLHGASLCSLPIARHHQLYFVSLLCHLLFVSFTLLHSLSEIMSTLHWPFAQHKPSLKEQQAWMDIGTMVRTAFHWQPSESTLSLNLTVHA
jgi:hypothetical protein